MFSVDAPADAFRIPLHCIQTTTLPIVPRIPLRCIRATILLSLLPSNFNR